MKNEKKKITACIVTIVLISLLLFFSSGGTDYTSPEEILYGNEPGFGEKKYGYEVTVGEVSLGNVDVTIPERSYTKKELDELYEESKAAIVYNLLSNNEDLTTVTEDLRFDSYIDGFPFSVSYFPDRKDYIGAGGEILTADEFTTTILVTCNYKDYSNGFSVKVRVSPGQAVKRRVYLDSLRAKLEENKNESDGEVLLPTEVYGQPVRYDAPKRKREPAYLLLGAAGAVGLLAGKRNDEKRAVKKRKDDILSEYPVIVQKMAIYLSTGMTVRNIWVKIYEEAQKNGKAKHPLYEEMGIAVNELQSGVSENLVYSGFGERTGVQELIRFTALLSQNLRKGNSKLREVLNEEVVEAYEKRKYRALKKGEEAGTKLLIPMMILLAEVLIMIMVPAFQSI